MKLTKRLFSILMTAALVLALSVSAFAADTYTITINNTASGHTYEAYQIFSGDLSGTTLSNIQWGSGVTDAGKTAIGKAADKAASLTTADDAKTFAQTVGQYLSTTIAGTSTEAKDESGKTTSYTIGNLAAGYYLVKDRDGTQTGGTDAYTGYILEVVKDTAVSPKGKVPTVEKKVKDTNDSTGETTDWQDSADYDIGDKVPFQLTGTLPANYADYTKYKYTFHDTESAGLTFDSSSVVVKVGDKTVDSSSYTVVSTGLTDGCTFEVQFTDLKAIKDNTGAAISTTKDSTITVEYTATLNENATLGSTGNTNDVTLEFSNNSNKGGEGDTGKTPKDTVIVFTYKTVINKVSKDKQPLTGAGFTLEKLYKGTTTAEDQWKAITVVENEAGTTFTFSGLDDGIYRLTETTTPAGYNSIDPIYFTVTAEHDVKSDTPTLTSLSAKQTDASGAEITTGAIASFSAVLKDGSVSTDIVNNAGSTLPSTGGIGTKIFTFGGIALMLAAAVMYITKRKVSREEK